MEKEAGQTADMEGKKPVDTENVPDENINASAECNISEDIVSVPSDAPLKAETSTNLKAEESQSPSIEIPVKTETSSSHVTEVAASTSENESASELQPLKSGDQAADGGALPVSNVQTTSATSSPAASPTGQEDSGLSHSSSAEGEVESPASAPLTTQGTDAPVGLPDTSTASEPPFIKPDEEDLESPTKPDTVTSTPDTGIAMSDSELPSGAVAGAASGGNGESVYYIKWISFGQNKVPIVTQNENGPCPLLAIMNVLLLKGKVKLAPMLEMVTSEQLMTYLGECIFDNAPQNLSETSQADYEQNMQDAMGVMYKLQTGLDVNVKFTGVGDFEYTQECIIFDLLQISLYHGWLVDPQDSGTNEAVNQYSYNQLVERIISLKHSDNEQDVTQALIAEQFLDRTASQLTYHGLCELQSVVKDKELCVFFRNNHFNTLYKHNNELFLLVTDQGFLTESNVVWETLSNVDGSCHFVDATFRTYTKPAPSTEPIPNPSVPVGSAEQIDHDYQVALFLQEEAHEEPPSAWSGFQQEHAAIAQTDLELAMHLQDEENRRAAEAAQQRANPPPNYPQGERQAAAPSVDAQRRRAAAERAERKEKEGKDSRSSTSLDCGTNCSIL